MQQTLFDLSCHDFSEQRRYGIPDLPNRNALYASDLDIVRKCL